MTQGVYTYRETVGDKSIPFYWQAETENDLVIITVNEGNKKSFINVCTPDGKTVKWILKDGTKHDVTAVRDRNRLRISGVRDGQQYEESIDIDDRPWFQPLSFSLRKFLNSNEKTKSFWTIRSDTVEVVELQVEKKGEEQVVFNEKTASAQKVEVRAAGFKSRFWHGTYWYRKSDNLFLMYRSVHGLPGTTDETIVELMKLPCQQVKS